jgi:hypothetical protein
MRLCLTNTLHTENIHLLHVEKFMKFREDRACIGISTLIQDNELSYNLFLFTVIISNIHKFAAGIAQSV